ncbi:hypothetical protein ACFLZ5_01825, partial [Thermodesulfobacteriota bacterium]
MNTLAVKHNRKSLADQKKDAQNRNQLTLFRYLQDVNSHKLLGQEETEALVIKYQRDNDQEA